MHFFNEELIDAHDALVDIKACRRIYFAIQSIKSITGKLSSGKLGVTN
jgi:hypothetical protein